MMPFEPKTSSESRYFLDARDMHDLPWHPNFPNHSRRMPMLRKANVYHEMHEKSACDWRWWDCPEIGGPRCFSPPSPREPHGREHPEVPGVVVAVDAPAVADEPGAVTLRCARGEAAGGEIVIPADDGDDVVGAGRGGGIIIGIVGGAVIPFVGVISARDRAMIQNGALDGSPVVQIIHV